MPRRVIPIQGNVDQITLVRLMNKNFAELDQPNFLSGTYTFPAVSVPASSNVQQTFVLKHGLRWAPGVSVFGALQRKDMNLYELDIFPSTIYYQLTYGYAPVGNAGPGMNGFIFYGADEVNVRIGRALVNGTGGALTAFEYTIRYYVNREAVS